MAAESKLEAARRSGNLAAAIGALREEARTTEDDTSSGREELDIVDASIRVAAGLSANGTKDAERREAINAVQVGKTVTPQGVAKTVLTREQKLSKTVAWVKSLTPDQRGEFMSSEKFDALSDQQQELIAEAIAETENSEFSTTAIEDIDLEAEPIDIDSLPEDETESPGESFEVLEGEDIESFHDALEAVEWEGQA